MLHFVEPSITYVISKNECVVDLSGNFTAATSSENKSDILDTILELEEDADEQGLVNGACEKFVVDITELKRLSNWGDARIKKLFRIFFPRAKKLYLVMPNKMAAMCGSLLVELSVTCGDRLNVVESKADIPF